MVFVNKKKKNDLNAIKRNVEGTATPEPPMAPDETPPPAAAPAPDAPPIQPAPTEQPTVPTQPVAQPRGPPGFQAPKTQSAPPTDAPLFVKIERYQEVLGHLDTSKNEIKSLAALFEMLMQLEEMRKGVENTIKEHIAEITGLLISLDEEFAQPQQAEGFVRERREVETEVQRYVNDLQRELKYLKDELHKI